MPPVQAIPRTLKPKANWREDAARRKKEEEAEKKRELEIMRDVWEAQGGPQREMQIRDQELKDGVPALLSAMRWAWRNMPQHIPGTVQQEWARDWLKRDEREFTDAWRKEENEFKKAQQDASAAKDDGGTKKSREYAIEISRDINERLRESR